MILRKRAVHTGSGIWLNRVIAQCPPRIHRFFSKDRHRFFVGLNPIKASVASRLHEQQTKETQCKNT